MKVRTSIVLSVIILALATIASLGGLFIPNLYRDQTDFVLGAWYANDLVTLFLAIPLLLGAIFFKHKGSVRGHLVWMGMVYFMMYNFAYYLFGAAFNWFFLIYVALFTLAIVALIIGVVETDQESITGKGTNRVTKIVSGFMVIWSLILSIAWIGQWVDFVRTDMLPALIVQTKGATHLVAALDLSFVIPLAFISGIWLWQNRPWGYVLALISNIKGSVYTAILIFGSIVQARAGVQGAMDLMGLWVSLFIGCLLSSVYLLRK